METTKVRLVDIASDLTQTLGVNGYSYADVSSAAGIRKASIHHHFPRKDDLSAAVLDRYRTRFAESVHHIELAEDSPRTRLTRYAALFADVFTQGGRLCLCGVFAADSASLPTELRVATASFFDDQRIWIRTQLTELGVPGVSATAGAEALLSMLEGALLLARAQDDGAETHRARVGRALVAQAEFLVSAIA